MSLYLTRAAMEYNGALYTDFKSFQEDPVIMAKAIPLMYKTGTAPLTRRYKFKVEYVVPQGSTGLVFDNVTGATFSVEYDGGERHDYGGCTVEQVAESKIDEENELVREITFVCESKDGDFGATV